MGWHNALIRFTSKTQPNQRCNATLMNLICDENQPVHMIAAGRELMITELMICRLTSRLTWWALNLALVGSICVIGVEEFLSLHSGSSSGGERSQELADDGVVAECVVGLGVGVEKGGCSMAQQLAVPISPVVIQSLQKSGGAIDVAGFCSECLGHLCVDGEERGPLFGMFSPVPANHQQQLKAWPNSISKIYDTNNDSRDHVNPSLALGAATVYCGEQYTSYISLSDSERVSRHPFTLGQLELRAQTST